jgi:spermidine synthase
MTRVTTVSASPHTGGDEAVRQRNISAVRPPKRRKRKIPRESRSFAFATLLFCSGAAALVYQVLWIKQLSLVVGVEVYSIAIAVSAFFAGLALGSFVIGRWADRLEQPLLLASIMEVGVALLGIAATLFLAHAAVPFAAMETRVGILAWLLPFVLVGVPAFLMGGTLPVIVRSWALGAGSIASTGGAFYAANTAGGIAGALLSSFAFLPWFGVRGTAFAAATLNLISAIIAFALNRNVLRRNPTSLIVEQQSFPRQAQIALMLYALAGGIALGYEVVWSQAIVQFLSTRSFAFSIVLATYLAGLFVGSALYARFADKVNNPWGVFGFLIAAAGFVALLEIAGLGIWQLQIQAAVGDLIYAATGNQFVYMCGRFFVAAIGIVFLPTTFLGAAFPAALQLVVGKYRIGRDIGAVIALNTAGGIAGTLLTGFFLVPRLGLVRTLGVLAIAAAAIGIFAAFRGPEIHKRIRWVVVAIGIVTIVGGMLTPSDRLARLLTMTRGGGSLVFYKESQSGTVAVVEERTGANVFRRLYIQGVSNSGDAMPSLRYMRLQALLPLIIHRGEPHDALVIGFGTGITAGALLQYPQMNRIVCAELLPSVVHAGPLFHGNFGAASSSKLQIRMRDGRRELLQNTQRYDLITLEPPPPSASGVVNLYSRDFYKLAASRLQPNGLFVQWLPLATQNNDDTRSLVRSFLDVFPFATLWTTELHEMLLVGSLAPIELDMNRINRRFNRPLVSDALKEVGIASPAALLATWVTGREGLENYAGTALPVTDDRPRIEYSSWVRQNEITHVLPELLALRTEPPLIDSSGTSSTDISAERENLMAFYAAGIAAYNGDRQAWASNISQTLRQDGDNPYYRWAVSK